MGQLFIIKPVEFEHGKEDPFGFDTYSEFIAKKYIPFSGTIRKPLYLLFVKYVNWLLDNKYLKGGTNKEDVRLRLEKLLVKCITLSNKSHRFIIGSTFRNVNPFKGNDGNWVIQNCFKIYDESSRILVPDELLRDYHSQHEDQIKLLNDFLKRTGTLDANKRYLDNLIKQLRKKKSSIFSGQLLLSKKFRDTMFRKLKKIIKEKKFGNDKKLINELFVSPSKAQKFLKHVLQRDDYPFKSLNYWFSSFLLAVDAEIKGEQSKALWAISDKNYQKIPDEHKLEITQRPTENSYKHTKLKCWFERKGNKYEKSYDFNESGWDALIRKAKRNDREIYTFRIYALGNLLKELDPHAN